MDRVLLFDMDGVLLNSESLHFRIWTQIFAERGLAIDFDHYKGCIGSTVAHLMELIYQGYGMDFRGDESLRVRFAQLKEEYIRTHGVPAVDGAVETIRALHAQGYRMAVASSSPQHYIELCTSAMGVADCFEVLFSGERVKRPKPAPDIFLAAAAQMGVSPDWCTVIEDSFNGSRAAKAAGMDCLGFANPDSGAQDLSAADRIFYPFSQLPQLL
ncbi:MAG: HAD family phosphatase [Ruminococcaceae bacterium]|nr:HAD family phosphatase [Oscillospiraceae bacterium]